MLRLIVIRHAKSDWEAGTDDHGRPLNQRGLREAPRLGAVLSKLGWIPELILSSDAMRTRQTVAGLAPWGHGARVLWVPSLYLAGLSAVREAIGDAPERAIAVVGHNSGWEDMVSTLCGVPTEMKTASGCLLSSEEASWLAAWESPFKLEHHVRASDTGSL